MSDFIARQNFSAEPANNARSPRQGVPPLLGAAVLEHVEVRGDQIGEAELM
jgi:hypothetical protein